MYIKLPCNSNISCPKKKRPAKHPQPNPSPLLLTFSSSATRISAAITSRSNCTAVLHADAEEANRNSQGVKKGRWITEGSQACKHFSQENMKANETVTILQDTTAGYCRILQDTADSAGYCRILRILLILQDTAGYCRILQDISFGFGMFLDLFSALVQDTAGYCRILLQDTAGYCRILQNTAG